MKRVWTFLLCTISSYSLAVPCRNITDPLERLACYEKAEDCVTVIEPAERLICFETVYDDDVDVVESKQESLQENLEPAEYIELDPVPSSSLMAGEAKALLEPHVVKPDPVADTPVVDTPVADTPEPVIQQATTPPAQHTSLSNSPVILPTILKVELNHKRMAYLTLDNGQVWKEISRSNFRYQVGEQVTITKGILGSTNLSVSGMSKYVKVKRVK